MKTLLSLLFLLAPLFSNEQFELGQKIYEDTCTSCHGKSGNADVDVVFVVKPRSLKASILTEEQSYKIIKDGAHYWGASADIMPAFGTVYEDKALHAVAYYIKKRFNPNIEEKIDHYYNESETISVEKRSKMMQRGKKIYKRNCSWCHGVDAKGDGDATRNPEKSIYPYNLRKTLLNNKQMFLYAKYGGKFWGTDKDDMPAWKVKYNDFTLKSVIFYIEQTFQKDTQG